MTRMKRGIALGDLHCGHGVGLTPPGWRHNPALEEVQTKLYEHYESTIKGLGRLDFAIVNGDLVDGKGHRSGGTELIESDLERQAEMAVDCLDIINAKTIIITYGTPYHVATGCGMDMENIIAKELKHRKNSRCIKIGGHEWMDVNGLVFDVKHKVGSSSVPHGRATAIKREALWNMLWAERDQNPRAQVLLRSHVHYHEYAGNTEYLAMTLPALQGPGSKYGVRQCSGVVDFGLVSFEVPANGKLEDLKWKAHVIKAVAKSEALRV